MNETEGSEGAAAGGASTVLTTGSPTTVGATTGTGGTGNGAMATSAGTAVGAGTGATGGGTGGTSSGGTNGGTAGSVDGGSLAGSGGAVGIGGAPAGTGGAPAGTGGAAGTGGTTGGSAGFGGATCRSGMYASHAYAFCDTPLNYAMARSDCAAKSMRLVRIDDAPENTWVQSMIPAADQASNSSTVWRFLGGNALVTAADWRWEDGQAFWSGAINGSAVNGAYTNWVRGEPGATGQCVFMAARGGGWNTVSSTQSHPYVCEQY